MPREARTTYRITDLEENERPRERLANNGPEYLSKAELIAILLRVGMEGENSVQMGTRILKELGGLSGIQKASFTEMCKIRGLGPAKAAQLKAAIELGRRLNLENRELSGAISSPSDAAELVRYEMQGFVQEQLWVILLDTRNRKIFIDKIYVGSLNSSMVRVAELFKGAIQRNAASVILVHNHPSGDPTPSPEDMTLTRLAVEAGKLMDIEVLDHLVIGQGTYVSMKEKGLGFSQ
ncbi:MAG: DNA repair protein RadC [Anaerolineaceae bacterium]|nr:DNA repair protein RadC [Anaerolineaceae bacterium]